MPQKRNTPQHSTIRHLTSQGGKKTFAKHVLAFMLLAFLLLHKSKSFAQGCGYSAGVVQEAANAPDYIKDLKFAIQKVKQKAQTFPLPSAVASIKPADYVIPVLVHVVHQAPETPISYAQVESQIDALNNRYAGTSIQFCLVKNKPSGVPAASWISTQPGVVYYPDVSSSYTLANITSGSFNDLAANTYASPYPEVLNIWVVKTLIAPLPNSGSSGAVCGYALPARRFNNYSAFNNSTQMDGVIVRACTFGSNAFGGTFSLGPACSNFSSADRSEGECTVHQVGHYLGLWDTHGDAVAGNGCFGTDPAGTPLTGCDVAGDFICDTKPMQAPIGTYCGPVAGALNTCPASGGAIDDVTNFMYEACDLVTNNFTPQQTTHMHAYLTLYRSFLYSPLNLYTQGVLEQTAGSCLGAGLYANFTLQGNPCVNLPITLQPDVPNPVNTATNWQWTITPNSFTYGAGTNQFSVAPVVQFNTEAVYTITALVSDGTSNISYTIVAVITNCSIVQGLERNGFWYFGKYYGITFNTGIPLYSNAAVANYTAYTNEGATSIADNNMNLIAYTDGTELFNNAHQQVVGAVIAPPASGLLDCNGLVKTPYSANGVVTCPDPTNANRHYIFGVAAIDASPYIQDLYWTLYDQGTNAVISAGVIDDDYIGEGINVVPHCNGRDYWVITYTANHPQLPLSDRRRWHAYHVSQYGLVSKPVISAQFSLFTADIDPARPGLGHGVASQVKVSTDNTHVLLSNLIMNTDFELQTWLYSFDNKTGAFSAEQQIGGNNSDYIGAASFDAGGNRIVTFDHIANEYKIFIPPYTAPPTVVANPARNAPQKAYSQLGPDGQVYFHQPNEIQLVQVVPSIGAAFRLNLYADICTNPNDKPSLPNFSDGIPPPPSTFTVSGIATCANYELTIPKCWGGYYYHVDWGDFTSSDYTAAGAYIHAYTTTGIFNVVVTLCPVTTVPPPYTVPSTLTPIIATTIATVTATPITAVITSQTACLPNSGSLTVTPSGGNGTYTITCTSGAYFSVVVGTQATFSNVAGGSYSISIASGGCFYQTVTNLQSIQGLRPQLS
jgi:hypothetical protein